MFSKKLAFSILLLSAHNAWAFPNILSTWDNIYPDSSSDDLQCQLCHAGVNGGSPWNAYGWDIRDSIKSGQSVEQSILLAENFDLDEDVLGINSFEEIIRNFQPGWRFGNNTLFFSDGTTLSNQPPPVDIPDSTAIDYPAELSDPILSPIPDSPTSITLVEVATAFSSPIRAVRAPGINGSLFVVEQFGRVFRTDLTTGEKTLFLDVSSQIVTPEDGCSECGLLGLAFHPKFDRNGLFYTYQSQPTNGNADFTTIPPPRTALHQSRIIEHRVSDSSCNSRITSSRTLLTINQFQNNHNGGDLVFDNNDLLYISLGDGGGASDFGLGHGLLGNGRNNTTVLGSILRIDPLGNNSDNGQYGIPADNPFVGIEGADEIFAYGFRNPFRMSIDSVSGKIYTGDVGQDDIEEVDEVVKGGNYGWNWKEGSFFFYSYPVGNTTRRFVSDVAPPGLPTDLIDPVAQYDHDEGFSVIGGYVYRGNTINSVLGEDSIQGKYLFADFNGTLFEMNTTTGTLKKPILASGRPGLITGFGEDANSELYLLTGAGAGSLFKITETGDAVTFPSSDQESAQCPQIDDMCFAIKTIKGNVATICL